MKIMYYNAYIILLTLTEAHENKVIFLNTCKKNESFSFPLPIEKDHPN